MAHLTEEQHERAITVPLNIMVEDGMDPKDAEAKHLGITPPD